MSEAADIIREYVLTNAALEQQIQIYKDALYALARFFDAAEEISFPAEEGRFNLARAEDNIFTLELDP